MAPAIKLFWLPLYFQDRVGRSGTPTWVSCDCSEAMHTNLQVLSGGHGARTYQDERFSYVVMRRGPRPGPESIPDLTVARQRQVDSPDAVQRAIEAGEHLPLSCLPPILFVVPTPTRCAFLCCLSLRQPSSPPPSLHPPSHFPVTPSFVVSWQDWVVRRCNNFVY